MFIGKYIYKSGAYYEGQMKDSLSHGQGKDYDASGKLIKQGRYENDKFIG